MISKYFYKLAAYYHGNAYRLWRVFGICILVLIPVALIMGVFFPENGFWPLKIFALITILAALVSLILTQAIKTYYRLDAERGAYKNHRVQEKLFTLAYSIALVVSVIGVFFVMLSSIIFS